MLINVIDLYLSILYHLYLCSASGLIVWQFENKTILVRNTWGKRRACIRNSTVIGLYRENAIAIESEANDSFGGNV